MRVFFAATRSLFTEFRAQFRAHLLTADFLFQKWAERQSVLAKHGGDQVYGVEPNIKEGAGGLRDIQNAEWMGEVRCHVSLSRLWPTLVEQGFVSAEDAAHIKAARDFLLCARRALHIVSGEARDTLTAEKQEAVAALLRYPDTPEVPAVEAFMRDYFTQAAQARRIARKVITRCLDSETAARAGAGFGRPGPVRRRSGSRGRDPALPLHVAELAQAYGLAVSGKLEEDIARYLQAHPAPADPAVAGRVFARLLTAGRGVADALDRLEELGALGLADPGVRAADDADPLRCRPRLHRRRAFPARRPQSGKSQDRRALPGRPADLRAKSPSPKRLYLAGLIHDIGKQWPDGPHAETGAECAAATSATAWAGTPSGGTKSFFWCATTC